MEELKLTAEKRDVLGKRNRFLRRRGVTPTHLFGHSLKSLSLQCDTTELKRVIAHAGETRLINLKVQGEKDTKKVFVREIQRDVLGKHLLHVDFYQIRMGEKMTMDVPIVLVGEAPALKTKGRMLSRGITELPIECLPDKVPPQIEIDVSTLEELEQAIQVKDIVLDPDIAIQADPDQMVVKVAEVMIEEEPVPEVAEEEEVEGEEVEAEEGAEKPTAEAAEEKAEKSEKED